MRVAGAWIDVWGQSMLVVWWDESRWSTVASNKLSSWKEKRCLVLSTTTWHFRILSVLPPCSFSAEHGGNKDTQETESYKNKKNKKNWCKHRHQWSNMVQSFIYSSGEKKDKHLNNFSTFLSIFHFFNGKHFWLIFQRRLILEVLMHEPKLQRSEGFNFWLQSHQGYPLPVKGCHLTIFCIFITFSIVDTNWKNQIYEAICMELCSNAKTDK